jgi:TPR repeat protein
MKLVLLLLIGLSLFGGDFESMKRSFENGDIDRAITYTRTPAMDGNVAAMYDLGLLYYAKGSLREALEWFQRSVKNEGKGQLGVSIILFSQSRNRDGYKKVVESLIDLPKSPLRDALMAVSSDLSANRNEASAESYLTVAGLFYDDSIVSPDQRIALFLTNQAANKGDAKAMELMGDAYWRSNFTQDTLIVAPQTGNALNIALEYYTNASNRGNYDAMAKAGKLFIIGPRNLRRIDYGVELITKAAEEGSTLAAQMLGEMYMNGEGVTANGEAALHWLLKATDHCDANRLLANLYGTGDEAKKYAEAYTVCSKPQSAGKRYNLLFEPF